MSKSNCWEFMNCGLGPGGERTAELGVCPASVEGRLEGIHGGTAGGRACWAVPGTLCNDEVGGTLAEKEDDCGGCGFYSYVRDEEGKRFIPTISLLRLLGDEAEHWA